MRIQGIRYKNVAQGTHRGRKLWLISSALPREGDNYGDIILINPSLSPKRGDLRRKEPINSGRYQ